MNNILHGYRVCVGVFDGSKNLGDGKSTDIRCTHTYENHHVLCYTGHTGSKPTL